MVRYINADNIEKSIYDYFMPIDDCHPMTLTVEQVMEVIDNMPTADVAEVVRCKDCIRKAYCNLYNSLFGANGFCSEGEEKECEK